MLPTFRSGTKYPQLQASDGGVLCKMQHGNSWLSGPCHRMVGASQAALHVVKCVVVLLRRSRIVWGLAEPLAYVMGLATFICIYEQAREVRVTSCP